MSKRFGAKFLVAGALLLTSMSGKANLDVSEQSLGIVKISLKDSIQNQCGGLLLNPHTVITTASCLINAKSNSPADVFFGGKNSPQKIIIRGEIAPSNSTQFVYLRLSHSAPSDYQTWWKDLKFPSAQPILKSTKFLIAADISFKPGEKIVENFGFQVEEILPTQVLVHKAMSPQRKCYSDIEREVNGAVVLKSCFAGNQVEHVHDFLFYSKKFKAALGSAVFTLDEKGLLRPIGFTDIPVMLPFSNPLDSIATTYNAFSYSKYWAHEPRYLASFRESYLYLDFMYRVSKNSFATYDLDETVNYSTGYWLNSVSLFGHHDIYGKNVE